MVSKRDARRLGVLIAAMALLADQVSKWAMLDVVGMRDHPREIEILPVFNLVMAWNHGTSFSLLELGSAAGPYIFSLASLVIVGVLGVWLYRSGSPILSAAIGAVIGGALGNVVDRLRFGAVVDFLDAHIGDYHWPSFNVADSLIVVGVAVLILDGMFVSRQPAASIVRREGS